MVESIDEVVGNVGTVILLLALIGLFYGFDPVSVVDLAIRLVVVVIVVGLIVAFVVRLLNLLN
jgi:hypothetical protein